MRQPRFSISNNNILTPSRLNARERQIESFSHNKIEIRYIGRVKIYMPGLFKWSNLDFVKRSKKVSLRIGDLNEVA